jgi:NADH-quinone oxidoreductase subunit J
MDALFYISAAVAIIATFIMVTRMNAVHALLYLVVSLLAVALVFYSLGAPFVAVLEVIIYAGAIMVLFVFVVMMLNLGKRTILQERQWQQPGMWVGPAILAAILIGEVVTIITRGETRMSGAAVVGPRAVSLSLFGPYLIGVELASMLLLAGLVGAYHLGRRTRETREKEDVIRTDAARSASGGDLVRAGNDRAAGSS